MTDLNTRLLLILGEEISDRAGERMKEAVLESLTEPLIKDLEAELAREANPRPEDRLAQLLTRAQDAPTLAVTE